MRSITGVAAALTLLCLVSCRATKKISTALPKKDSAQTVMLDPHADSVRVINQVFEGLEKNRISYETFSGKIKVDYWDKDGKGPDLTVFIRMKRDSIIWLSVNATVFSYEAFRILITPDSVKVINKKDKVVQFRSVKYLEEMARLPFDFKNFQDVLVGNPIFVDSNNIISYRRNADAVSILSIGELFKNLLTLSNDNFLLQHIKLDDVDVNRNRTCDLSYGNYNGASGKSFATYRKISLAEKTKLDVQMEFKQYSFNESLNYPFSVPKNYTVQ
ncbi:DUF4292 domain-containing protein [Flavihumibacter petaseus]|uniref:DUF4292 domain-containing protein n=1 Tax=Flavihumibacter petaseus NBRC 106054 TaxID=1220578 RepID=A0A0E9MWY3_9BACT|nr:DUF4292 domain-containing protein [Flavihumibacter petaseus]GAO41630.1 hypothetical protein FPE01S_01_06440 [Flavihumibacter petaseus NBRC 106054]